MGNGAEGGGAGVVNSRDGPSAACPSAEQTTNKRPSLLTNSAIYHVTSCRLYVATKAYYPQANKAIIYRIKLYC